MEKSVYSLVLMDEVVAAVDRMAARQGVSRSALVNSILAEYAGFSTPQQRIREIFDAVNAILDTQSVLQPLLPAGDAMLALRSALQYKYNPSMRYTVELYPDGGEVLGALRVNLRTQNPSLLLYLGQFYRLWSQLEAACLSGPRRNWDIDGARYTRQLRAPLGEAAEDTARAIADYVQLFDDCLKTFFDRLDSPAEAAAAVQHTYTHGLSAPAAEL